MKACFGAVAGFALFVGAVDTPDTRSQGITGTWDLTVREGGASRAAWVRLIESGGDSGPQVEFVSRDGQLLRAKAKIDCRTARWETDGRLYEAECSGNSLKGRIRASQGSDDVGSFKGRRIRRKPDLSGVWDLRVSLPMRTMERTLEVEHDPRGIKGTYAGTRFGKLPIGKTELTGDVLKFEVAVDADGFQATYGHQFDVRGDQLDGQFYLNGDTGPFEAEGLRRRRWADPFELFTDKKLSNWRTHPESAPSQWRAVDGVLVNAGPGASLYTDQDFRDFKLKLEVKLPPGGDSGVLLRGRYEIQLVDDAGKPPSTESTGALRDRIAPSENASRPAGQWQQVEVTLVDFWLTVVINGKTVIENRRVDGITSGAMDGNETAAGPILLQGSRGGAEFRKISVAAMLR